MEQYSATIKEVLRSIRTDTLKLENEILQLKNIVAVQADQIATLRLQLAQHESFSNHMRTAFLAAPQPILVSQPTIAVPIQPAIVLPNVVENLNPPQVQIPRSLSVISSPRSFRLPQKSISIIPQRTPTIMPPKPSALIPGSPETSTLGHKKSTWSENSKFTYGFEPLTEEIMSNFSPASSLAVFNATQRNQTGKDRAERIRSRLMELDPSLTLEQADDIRKTKNLPIQKMNRAMIKAFRDGSK